MAGMKRPSRILMLWALGAGLILAAAGTVYGAMRLARHQIEQTAPVSPACAGSHHANHQATIQNDVITPANTMAKLCDTLMITNRDERSRLIAFGVHDHHAPYDGIEERLLGQGESFTITLLEAGTFRFHDHTEDEVQATFVVTPKK
jgi:plastocyanin